MTGHKPTIKFYYPDEPDPVFAVPDVALNDLGGSALTDGVEIALGRALHDFNDLMLDKLTDSLWDAATSEDNATYNRICQDRQTVVENIGEIEHVLAQAIRLRSN